MCRGVAQLVERRSPKPKVAGSIPAAPANREEEEMKTSPAQFVRQVKQEIAKITWPARAVAMRGTITVIVMSVVLAAFLLVVDMFFAGAIQYVLKF